MKGGRGPTIIAVDDCMTAISVSAIDLPEGVRITHLYSTIQNQNRPPRHMHLPTRRIAHLGCNWSRKRDQVVINKSSLITLFSGQRIYLKDVRPEGAKGGTMCRRVLEDRQRFIAIDEREPIISLKSERSAGGSPFVAFLPKMKERHIPLSRRSLL